MPRVIETTVYKYDELNDKAKAKARDWWREECHNDMYFAEFHTAKGGDFETIAGLMGWSIDKAKNGRADELAIYWSGFSSQGDGLHFVGRWKAGDVDITGLKAHAPKDMELHRIADAYATLVAGFPSGIGTIEGRMPIYVHEMTVTPVLGSDGELYEEPSMDMVETFVNVSRSLMKWMYRSLESSYTASQEDDEVAETIRANEYEFLESGKRA